MPGGAVRPRWQHDLVRNSFLANVECDCAPVPDPTDPDRIVGATIAAGCLTHGFLVVEGTPTVELPNGYQPP